MAGLLPVGLGAAAIGPSFAKLQEVPITDIRPEGWLREYLVHQRDGLTGHLENAGYPFNTVGWRADRIPDNTSLVDWWPYEQNGYWIDGMIRCGLLLDDPFLIGKARSSIDYVLSHPAPNGYLGPKLEPDTGAIPRWIHAVFFRALMADYSGSRDPRILAALERHYLAGDYHYAGDRDAVNIEGMLWLYGHDGDVRLLHLAERVYQDAFGHDPANPVSVAALLSDEPANDEHGVTFNETAKLGAILYAYTGDPAYLKPSVAAYRKLDRANLLVSGVNVSSEQIHPVTSIEACENCDISDYTWSLGYLLMATGDPAYADQIERAAFNAGPGSVTADFKALQYFTSPNQVVCTHASFVRSGGAEMSYSPNPGTECCPGNVNRMMPNFASRLWMTDGRGGLTAAMYAPSRIAFAAGAQGRKVEVAEATRYPFGDEIRFVFTTPDGPVRFPFSIRIPGWCRSPEIAVNGKRRALPSGAPAYFAIEREFRSGDVITLRLPQRIRLESGPDHTVSIVRGPLVYSLRIDADWKVDPDDRRSTRAFPAYDVYPTSPWNYALCLDPARIDEEVRTEFRAYSDSPWSARTAPIALRVPARRVRGWQIERRSEVQVEHWNIIRDPKTGRAVQWIKSGFDRKTGRFLFTPPVPDPRTVAAEADPATVMVTLIPYGSAKLRITYFPWIETP
ncbi:MAG TPA: beta-L-arabinofuranosidase domain-containing protein [Opitutaceae bacterium]|jgi:hypothetical protein|nr:beta-L-arabinofuranosidase domain-containing protein [Opitutaceae bacterium]